VCTARCGKPTSRETPHTTSWSWSRGKPPTPHHGTGVEGFPAGKPPTPHHGTGVEGIPAGKPPTPHHGAGVEGIIRNYKTL